MSVAWVLLLLLPVHGCEAQQQGFICVPMLWLVGSACAGQALLSLCYNHRALPGKAS